MKDIRKPSKAMVKKLLSAQGMDLKFNKFIRQSAYSLCLPYLSSVDTDDEKIQFIEDHLDDEVVLDAFTEIYSKHFSVTEMMDIIAFYKSPTGQKLSKTQDRIAMDMVGAAQQLVQRIILKAMKYGLQDSLEKLEELDLGELEDPDKFEELT